MRVTRSRPSTPDGSVVTDLGHLPTLGGREHGPHARGERQPAVTAVMASDVASDGPSVAPVSPARTAETP